MGTDALLIVKESGKEEERDLDFLPEDTIIASVLLSFKFKFVHCHPGFDVISSSTLLHGEIWDFIRGRRFLKLGVSGV